MPKSSVWGVEIDDQSPERVLSFSNDLIHSDNVGFIATVNAEFLILSRKNNKFKKSLGKATIRLCDGVGVQWAAGFHADRYPAIINLLRLPFSGLKLLLSPGSAGKVIKHRYTGRQLFEDLLSQGSIQGWSFFFLGGAPGVAEKTACKAKALYPGINIAGCFAGTPDNPQEIKENLVKSNILFVAYGPPKQEVFISESLESLQTNLAVGVGGTFDYFTQSKPVKSSFRAKKPPEYVATSSLEWLWRLITQPGRLVRTMRSVFGFAITYAWSRNR